MIRRQFILLGSTFWLSKDAFGQTAGRKYSIGSLHAASLKSPHHEALVEELGRAGFMQGLNLALDPQGYELRQEQFVAHASVLSKARVDLILCGGDAAIRAAQEFAPETPIVGVTEDIVGAGIVQSLSNRSGNVTGISLLASDLDPKRQEILMELVPDARHVGVLSDKNTVTHGQLDLLAAGANSGAVKLSIFRIGRKEDISPAIDEAKKAEVDALNVLATPLFFNNRAIIFERVSNLRMPTIYQWPEMAEEGGLVAYGPRIVEIYRRQVSRQIVRLFRGAKPSDIPIEQPSVFDLVINLKAANGIGLKIAPAFLSRADKVID